MYHLLRGSNFEPHHVWWFTPSPAVQMVFFNGLMKGKPELYRDAERIWLRTKMAELMGPKPAAFCCHLDSVFAPTLKKIYPKMKILCPWRHPHDVFKSFLSKYQLQHDNQMRPVDFDGTKMGLMPMTEIEKIAWLLKWTQHWRSALKMLWPDDCLLITSEEYFAGDFSPERMGWMPAVDYQEHVKTKINEKGHKVVKEVGADEIAAFDEAWDKF
jgi:hypothetical protein